MSDNTIIGASFEAAPLRSMLTVPAELAPAEDEIEQRLFKIRAADTAGRRSSANILINRRYAWRGYSTKPLPEEQSLDRITLVASDHAATIGTMSIGFDGASGLLVEQLFGAEVDALRRAGCRICEFTQLAMDNVPGSKRVLASLFHVAYIYAYRVKGFDSLLIEVNPRHVKYYERILGFKVLGPERMNPRVNAPAVLLSLDFRHTEKQIGRFGGNPQLSSTERSLYPYAFSIAEEAGIVGRLKSAGDAPRASS
ncbi:N-acyl amino acid synthase FeeM domain-containing protein [Piscinibacter koreensis]|uniref:Long-chain N-acyl amino acid synthase n=1 Tax=Piscinibacter koreensis TaxID=2742824 RepID=A0A7Y6NKZ0_9BURK|nr:long-chain N-acyl amino acid synthase [Schlegelella koreensis]NUZ05128.1 long-chain N-acyl amino acid synthase [Schlegelella koreensis]